MTLLQWVQRIWNVHNIHIIAMVNWKWAIYVDSICLNFVLKAAQNNKY